MAKAPKVQKLSDIMAGLDPAYAGQRNIFNQQLSAVPAKFDAQKTALGVAKENEFRDINRGANARGMAFSGIPIEEQTRYLGEQYLPALAGYDQQAASEQQQLQLMLAQLGADQRLKAIDLRTGQKDTLTRYLEAQRQRQFEAKQSRLARQFEAKQSRLARQASAREAEANRNFQARQNAASRSAARSEAKGPSNAEVFASAMSKSAGRDGKVSPGTYNSLKNQWVASGYGSYKDFHDRFWKFANEKHWWDYR